MAVLKTPGQDRPPTTRKRRLWSVDPPPAPSAQWYEGYEILEEIPTAAGLALFEWLRAVRLWNSIGPESAVGSFRPLQQNAVTSWGAESVDAPPDEVARTFARLFAAPESMRTATLVRACTFLSEWAADEGYVATAAIFADAAAELVPNDPDLAFRAGRANRRNVAYVRAALWFQRGTGIARRAGNWTSYVDCWLGWGNLEIARGRYDAARRLLLRAYRAARKYNLPELAAAAQHDLFMLCVDQRNFTEAYKHGAEALALYSPDHPSYPYIVHDLAQTWALDGYVRVALPLLQVIRKHITVPSAQIQIAGNIARAAGQIGDIDEFYASWEFVSNHAVRPVPYVAAALISIAEGAFALRLNRQASEAATKGLRFAEQRQEATEERRARELLEKIRRAEPPPPPRDPPDDICDLAALLLSRMQQRTEPT